MPNCRPLVNDTLITLITQDLGQDRDQSPEINLMHPGVAITKKQGVKTQEGMINQGAGVMLNQGQGHHRDPVFPRANTSF